jgi:hypothetical protein
VHISRVILQGADTPCLSGVELFPGAVVDAFTDKAFAGNPAGLVLCDAAGDRRGPGVDAGSRPGRSAFSESGFLCNVEWAGVACAGSPRPSRLIMSSLDLETGVIRGLPKPTVGVATRLLGCELVRREVAPHPMQGETAATTATARIARRRADAVVTFARKLPVIGHQALIRLARVVSSSVRATESAG